MDSQIIPRDVLQRAFPGINDQDADEMCDRARLIECPAETILCHENAFETDFYILLDGEVRVTKLMDGNQSRLMKMLHPGDFFGEMAIVHNAPRAASVTTTTPSRLLMISKDAFSSLLERSSSISLAVVREVSRRLRENDDMAIGDLREKARELADAYQQLAELEYARHEFLTTIAHELRTPLMAANGFLHLIRSGSIHGDALTTALEVVGRHLSDITSLTNDILFLQEMDLILPDFRPVDISEVLTNTVEQHRVVADNNKVGLVLNTVSSLPRVSGDDRSLARAFQSFLDNAIKFSPDGGNVRIVVIEQDGDVRVIIQDDGVGIPPEALPHIFKRFYHLDEVNGRLFRGVGLGLSIAREVIEHHHGSIHVESELGKGSRFIIHLPGICGS